MRQAICEEMEIRKGIWKEMEMREAMEKRT